MKQTSMTALVSAFARAYHAAHNTVKIFDDPLARRLLTDGEYAAVSSHMADGSSFFAPSFAGSRDDALRLIVDRFLSPAPLARAAFTEEALRDAAADGAAQYLLFGAGYDFPALEALLHAHGFRVRAHWSPDGITARWFSAYNAANPAHPMAAGPGAGLCLAEISSFTKYSSNRAPKGI